MSRWRQVGIAAGVCAAGLLSLAVVLPFLAPSLSYQIRDHEALAQALPGTEPVFIPTGAYGPGRRIPPEPVPTIAVASLLVARRDLPGRVARDILDVVYDPRFARDIQYELAEDSGRKVGHFPLHPAAEIFYHRNDLLTSDRMGRLAFVAWIIGAAVAVGERCSNG